ncbi:MAG TPA: redoxin domain-containing protein [Kofleriaceae bacterium]|nr:redoxin domain-containing protein [Kofleriaceae bacterium]
MRALPVPLLLLLACNSKPAATAQPADVGTAAPDFSLAGSDGKTHSLAELRGKRAVVVAWFPKAFTGGCTAECKSLTEGGEALRKYDAAYFAVSTDTPEDNKKFAESLGADFPILADPTADTARAYGVLGKDGKHAKRWTFYIGVDGKISDIDREVKPATAAADVASRLEKLGIAKLPPS